MAYCVQADIEKMIPTLELAELTTESGSTPSTTIVDEAIAKADAEIDSYLGVVHTVPFTTVPARVKSLSGDIAIYYLYVRRSVVPEARQKAYDDAIIYLRDVAAGDAVLIEDSGGSSSGRDVYEFSSAEAIFNRANMTSW